MKILIIPIASAVLATAFCVLGCHVFGMPRSDLFIAAVVAGSVSVSVAVGAALLAKSRRHAG